MRALRDANLPKIVTSDAAVFMGLIEDLFPGLDLPPTRSPELTQVRPPIARRHAAYSARGGQSPSRGPSAPSTIISGSKSGAVVHKFLWIVLRMASKISAFHVTSVS